MANGAKRAGIDLSDVFRDIVQRIMDEQKLGQADLAKRLGIAQSTVSRFLSGESPGKIDMLTRLCIVLDLSLTDVVALHPLFEPSARDKVTLPKDHHYVRFQRILRNADARALLEALDRAERIGATRQLMEAGVAVLDSLEGAVKAERRRSRRDALRPRRRKSPARKKKPGEQK